MKRLYFFGPVGFIGLIILIFLYSGCARSRVPTATEQTEIQAILSSGGNIANIGDLKIEIKKDQATAYYLEYYQVAAESPIPVKAELKKISGKWMVVSRKANFSEKRRIEDQVIRFHDKVS